MAYSSISSKKCKCGCGQYPTLSYNGYFRNCAPQEVLDRLDKRTKRKNALKKDLTKLRNTPDIAEVNNEMVKSYKSKSELLKQADRVFGDWIKSRDTKTAIDSDGNEELYIVCPCCNQAFGIDEVDSSGKILIQPLHFVSRGVYDLRFSDGNCFTGDAYCNLAMHLNPKGKEYQNYRKFLVGKFGEPAVAEMELAKRKINKIDEQMLKTVIDHYS